MGQKWMKVRMRESNSEWRKEKWEGKGNGNG